MDGDFLACLAIFIVAQVSGWFWFFCFNNKD